MFDRGKLFRDGIELALHKVNTGLDLADLATCFGEDWSQRVGQIGVRILDESPRGGDHFARSDRYEDSELAQKAAQRIQPGRALEHPARP